MKKFYLFLAVCFISIGYIHANQVENFWLDYSDMLINKEQAIQILYDSYDMPEGSTLLCTREVKDNTDMKHYTIQQYVNDIKVEGCYVLIHEKEGKVYSVNGRLLNAENSPKKQNVLSKKQIKAKLSDVGEKEIDLLIFEHNGKFYNAYKYYDKERYAYVYVDAHTGIEIISNSIICHSDVQGTSSTLYNGTQNITCYLVDDTYILFDEARNIYTLNARRYDGKNDSYLDDFENLTPNWVTPILSSVTIEWSSQDWWYNSITDTKPDFYIQISSGGTVLYISDYFNDTDLPVTFNIPVHIEANGNLKLEVFDYDGVLDDTAGKVSITKTYAGNYSWNNSKTRASYTLTNNPAYDVHWGTAAVYDFYKSKFDHKSYDRKGGQVINLIGPYSSDFREVGFPNNACAIGNTGRMAYGLGDKIYNNPWVALDVIGHEFTHMVTASNGEQNLPNNGEGGALNESFGDILGNAIENFTLGSTDWLFAKGVDLTTDNKANRSLADPKSMASPTTYLNGEHWKPITGNPDPKKNDNDWVHINCGVQNYWFYLLCEGGSGHIDDNPANESYSVVGIGMDKAIQIVYNNLLYYITSTSNYPDSREGSIKAAIQLYGKDSQEYQSVINAWHAVGVGEKYVAPNEDFQLKPGKYVIVANRVENDKNNWYYMTSDLGTASTKRFQAVSAGNGNIDAIETTKLEDKYIWELEADGSNWKLKNGGQYITWKSGNSANLDATGKSLTFDVADNQVVAHFYDGSAERYLSLHVGNDYFAFYANTGQIEQLYFLPCEEGQQPPVEEPADEFIVLAQRNENSNWFYMTADLGTAGTKRFQAIDAGTPNKALINTSPTDTKYIWSFEEVDGGVALVNGEQYASWKSGNSAILSTTPMALNITDVSEDQVNMSFVDGEGYTRYLSLNATAGNNYFAFYKGTTQKCNLLIIPYGEKITTDIDVILHETPIIHKVIRDGQLLIIRDGKTYNAQGAMVY